MSKKWIFTFENFQNLYWHGREHSALVEFVKKMWFIKLPTENTFVVTLGAFVKCFCESSSFPQKCIRSYIGCIWSRASQENRIRFVNLMVCFDLLSPKFLIMRARQLKKGEQNGISMVVTFMPEKVKIKSNSPQISLTAAAGCWQAYPCCPSWVWCGHSSHFRCGFLNFSS